MKFSTEYEKQINELGTKNNTNKVEATTGDGKQYDGSLNRPTRRCVGYPTCSPSRNVIRFWLKI